ncbi:MAG TPA: DUF4326 domain-containing protein [Kineosporiaceae bacterium]|nr:DUF4326 domain-containing protein [Kineosporiaceae bacterium]
MSARIQLRRIKGWRKPEGAVVVARPTKWGNPFILRDQTMGLVQEPGIGGDREWDYEGRISAPETSHDFYFGDGRIVHCWNRWATRTEVVELFRLTLTEPTVSMRMAYPSKGGRFAKVTVEDIRRELAGKDLACWCDPDVACHADVLLELANGGGS